MPGRPSPRTSAQLLLDRDFAIFLWAKLALNGAIWAQVVAAIALAYALTESATWVGLVGAAALIPQLVFCLVSGRLSDTYGPLAQIVVGGVLAGLGPAALSVYYLAFGEVSKGQSAVPVLVASAVFGCGQALASPAMVAAVPRMVTSDELSAATALNFMPTALARTIGPAAGAGLVALLGPVATLGLVGAALALSGLGFLLVHAPGLRAKAAPGEDGRIATALRYVWADRTVFVLLVAVAVVGFASEPAITLGPTLIAEVGDPSRGGWVTAAFGVGGLFGVVAHQIVRRWLSSIEAGCAAMVVLGLVMSASILVNTVTVLLGLLAVGGMAMVTAITAFSVAVQERCVPAMLGRVMGLWVLAFAGVRPLAGMSLGVIADHLSTESAMWLAGVLSVLTAFATGLLARRWAPCTVAAPSAERLAVDA